MVLESVESTASVVASLEAAPLVGAVSVLAVSVLAVVSVVLGDVLGDDSVEVSSSCAAPHAVQARATTAKRTKRR